VSAELLVALARSHASDADLADDEASPGEADLTVGRPVDLHPTALAGAHPLGERAEHREPRLGAVDEVDPVEERIFDRLAGAAYHVVHYMGHGDFAATKGGMLLLEDADGHAVPTSAKAFAHLLRDEPLRLVFLNACDTGATPQLADLHPFAGVAAALVANGVPAVVAMQFPITDRAALTFSKVFYARIAAGDAVDVAVAQGRSALYLAAVRAGGDDAGGEWATPVLYMRAEDGAVLGTGRAATAPAVTSAAPPRAEMTETSGRPGFWKRQSGLTWGLLGAVIAIVALFAVLLLSPDPASTTPPASATAPAPQAVVAAPVGPPPVDGPATIAQRKAQLLTPVPPAVLAIAIESIDAIPAEAWIDDAPRGSDRTVADSEVFVHFIDRFTTRLLMQEGEVFEDLNALFSAVIAGAKPDTAAKSAYLLAMCIDSERCNSFVWDSRSEYLTKAADGGVPVAMAALAEAYLRGDELLTQSLPIAESWLGKARANRRRDALATSTYREQGWVVIRVWEHDLAKFPRVAEQIAHRVRSRVRAVFARQ